MNGPSDFILRKLNMIIMEWLISSWFLKSLCMFGGIEVRIYYFFIFLH